MQNIQNQVLVNFPGALISLMPLFLITGPFLPDLSLVLVCIFFLVNVYLNKDFSVFKSKYFIIFVIFFLYLLFNSIIKFYDYNNVRSSLGYLRFGIFTLEVIYFIERKHEILKWIFYVFLFSFLVLIIDGYIQYFYKINIFSNPVDIRSGRIRFFFNDDYILGSYLSRLFPFFLGLTFYLFKNNNKIIFSISILFVLIETLIFLSGERVSFFFNTLGALFIILMIKNFKKVRILTLLISVIIIFVITAFDYTAKKRMWDHTINQIGFNSSKLNIFSKVHESHYKTAYYMFLDNKLMGVGIRNFRNFCNNEKYRVDKDSCTTHPHNTYVQLLSETGLIGFTFAAIIFFYFSFKSLQHLINALFTKKYKFNDFEVCLMASILISIWPLAPSGNFFNNWISIVYYLPVGFFFWSIKNKKN